jgi:flavin-binding protein dodecin
MPLVKVIEVIAESNQGWEHAAQEALRIASKSVRNIRSIYVKDMQAVVENNQIVNYRLNAKISFVLEE